MTHTKSLETAKCSSATTSEKIAFVELLKEAKTDLGDRLNLVTTDGHVGIGAHMRTKEPSITHNQVS